MAMTPRKLFFEFSIVVLILLVLGVPRLPALGRFVTADEPTWGKRSASFYYAFSNGEYAATYLSPHPGVTTMWAGAAAFHLKFPKYQHVGLTKLGDTRLFQIFQHHGLTPMEVLVQARLLVVSINILVLLLSFYFLRQLLGTGISLLGITLIGLDPFFVAHSRLLHIDGLLSSFVFLSICAFLVFLKGRSWPALSISGIAAGLAVLTKTPAVILMPFVGLLALLEMPGFFSLNIPARFSYWSKKIIAPLAFWGLIAVAIFILLWPAMWVSPARTIVNMARYSLLSAEGELGGAQFIEAFAANEGEGSQYFYFYPLTYLWRSTPLVLLGLLLAGVALWSRFSPLERDKNRKVVFGLLFFSLLFLLAMSLGSKKFDRYLLPVYLPLDVVAAAGWAATFHWLLYKFTSAWRYIVTYAMVGLLIGVQSATVLLHFPYYLTYFNPMFGGIRKAQNVLMVGWGEGLNQAALYIREKPEFQQLHLLSWYPLAFNWYSSSFKFTSEPIPFPSQVDNPGPEHYLSADYVIVYINQWQRRIPGPLFDLLENRVPEHTIWLKGVEYVRIYRLGP